VRDFSKRFKQEQAPFGNGEVDPPSCDVVDDAVVVARRIISKKREHESVFAFGGTVTRPRITAGTEKDGHHVLTKTRDGFAPGSGPKSKETRQK
jgi:hypothetical protein